MHVTAWTPLRLAARVSVRVSAHRRNSPRERQFHPSKTLLREPESTSLPSSSSNTVDSTTARAEQHDVPEEAAKPDEGAALQDAAATKQLESALRDKLRKGRERINNTDGSTPYGSAVKRSQRNGRPAAAPSIALPEWFLDGNVRLVESLDRSTDASDEAQHPGDGAKSTGQVRSVSGVEDRRPHLDAPLMWEIETAVIAALATAKTELSNSFPAVKSNILLHCPLDGASYFLDKVVADAAASVSADVITLDAQDLAVLGGEFLKDDPHEMSTRAIRSLGYNVHQLMTAKETHSFDDGEDGEENDDMDDEHIMSDNRRKVSRFNRGIFPWRNSLPELAAHATSIMSAFSSRNRGPHAVIVPGGLVGRPSEPDVTNKMGALLDALLEGPSLKRARLLTPSPSETTGEANADQPGRTLPHHNLDRSHFKLLVHIKDYREINAQREGGKILDQLVGIIRRRRSEGHQLLIIGTTASAELTPENSISGIAEMQTAGEDSFFRTIYVVPSEQQIEIEELFENEQRHRIIALNIRLLQDMVLRMDPSETAFANDNSVREQITKKLDALTTQFKSLTHTKDDAVAHDASPESSPVPSTAGIVAVLQEQIQRMLGPSGNHYKSSAGTEGGAVEHVSLPEPRNASSSMGIVERLQSRLERNVWAFDSVHRMIATALSLKLKAGESLDVDHVVSAMIIISASDELKYNWAKEHPGAEINDVESGFPSPRLKMSSLNMHEDRLKRLRRNANDHETKLLPGVIRPDAISTRFSDVHAPPETIEALKTLTSLSLIRPEAFKYGVLATDKIPGLLLYGPPGTGKTLLAKAVAKESGATMLEVSGSEVYDMYVGEGEKNVKAIFSLAKKLSPCVVFIDEADAIFGSRAEGSRQRTSHRELINQFLKEWDGMNDSGAFIMVATNRPFDLDDAVLRRLPRRLLIDLPLERDRESILKIHLKDEQLDSEVKFSELAAQTPLYSGSDLKNVAVAAALACVREENEEAARHRASAEAPPSAFIFPERRILQKRHFEKAVEEISASISEDMGSLIGIKKFDEKYGDRRSRRKKLSYGFTVGEPDPRVADSAARVRN